MDLNLDWLSVLLLVGAGHGLLLAITLFTLSNRNRLANRIFAGILLVFAGSIFLHTLSYTHTHLLKYPHLSKIEPALLFLFGPLFYFYVLAMTNKHFRFQRKHLLHFLPFVACLVILTPYYFQSADEKIRHIISDHEHQCLHCLILYWAVTVQILFYIIILTKTLLDHKKKIKEHFSAIEKINLNWLQKLLAAVVITWFVALLMQLFEPTIEASNYVWLLVSVNMYLIGYIGLRQPEVFSSPEEKLPLKKYEKSTLTQDKAEEYLERLSKLMVREKPFLDGNLTLQNLAKKLSISPHHLSQIINEKLQQNFFEFVNSHRVTEAKKLLAKPENRNLNVAEIGFEAGFNSISAFNAAFKKHADMTPSQFLHQCNSK